MFLNKGFLLLNKLLIIYSVPLFDELCFNHDLGMARISFLLALVERGMLNFADLCQPDR